MEQKWIKSFNITPQMLEKWTVEKPSDTSALLWFLTQERIPWVNYINWAQREFQLPALKDDFFAKTPQKEIIDLFKNNSELWSKEFLPVAVWDNIVYIACLHPPEKINLDVKHQLTLAPPENLERWWDKMPKQEIQSVMPSHLKIVDEDSMDFPPITKKSPPEPQSFFPEIPGKEDNDKTIVTPSSFPTPPPIPNNLRALKSGSKSKKSADWKKIGQEFFPQMEQYYEQTMLMTLSGHNLWPTTWNKKWARTDSQETNPVRLGSPSIFEIVSKTQKPYHGYIHANPVNDDFLSLWHFGQPVEHITIVPIILRGQIEAMLLGIAKSSAHYDESLKSMEKWAKEISDQTTPPTPISKSS